MMTDLTKFLLGTFFVLASFLHLQASVPIVQHKNINVTRIDLSNRVVLARIDMNIPSAGKVVVRFDGKCVSSPGDRIVLAASDDANWHVNDGNVGIEATTTDYNRNAFSHTRVYDVAAGTHDFYAIAHNYVEYDGNGEASIYGTLTAEFYPNQTGNSPKVYAQGIKKTRINVRTEPVVLAQQSIRTTAPAKVIVRFDGQCIASVGDRIVLAASNNSNWHVNDGNTSVEAVNADVNGRSFSHSRVYTVGAGTHTFYSIAHNYVETAGSGIASIYGTLTVEVLPTASPTPFVLSQGINRTRIDVNARVTLAQQTINVRKKGKVVVRFDGQCIADVGDRIVLAASNDPNWHVNDGNVSVEPISNDLNGNPFSHTRVYDVSPGSHTFYAVAHNYVETAGNGIASFYGNLTVQFYADEAYTCFNNLPNPNIELTSVNVGETWTSYRLNVTNKQLFPDALFATAPDLPACSLNTNSSRTWVNIYDQDRNYIYGFCALSAATQLGNIWFSRKTNTCPPEAVYIQLIDRACNRTYTSNLLRINQTPNPKLVFGGQEDYQVGGQEWTRYRIPVENAGDFSDALFAASPDLPACGLNSNASRTWVRIYDQDDNYLYGFCALSAASQLKNIWFARPKGTCPPKRVYIKLIDRLCDKTYTSNLLTLPECSANRCPDLVVTKLSILSHSATNVRYGYTIKNIGTAPVDLNGPTPANHDNVSVQAFVSKDAIFNNGNDLAAGGTILGVSPLPTLQAGETYSGSFGASVRFDPSVYRYLTLKVDWGAQIDECNEDNNTASQLFPSNGKPSDDDRVEGRQAVVVTDWSIYPNPATATSEISIQLNLAEATAIAFELYASNGQKVQQITNPNQLEAGTHTFTFQANQLEKGLYFIRAIMNNQVLTKRLTLVD